MERELCARYRSVRLKPNDEPLRSAGLRTALRDADVVLSTITDRLDAELFAGGVRGGLLGQFGAGWRR